MIIELGHFALVLALLVALLQIAPAVLGARIPAGAKVAVQASVSSFWLVTIALLSLMHAFALSDFSVLNVATNSNTMKPLAYKLAAVWGSHEGSMLLWLWMMCGWCAAFAQSAARQWKKNRSDAMDQAVVLAALAVQGLVTIGFALFILLTSNPFARLSPVPPEGLDLNPVLQDPLLVIHPPLLYLGVTGFALVFAFAIASLVRGRVDAAFARHLRPWTMAAWVWLTCGIALGSFWAYYELGWGGFWFWDPVENISLLPWLAGVALLHSLRALERRNALPVWTLLLAIIPFILAVMGTFLVRSGLLTSVHAFAADPARGVFLLALTVALAASALTVYALRAPRLTAGAPFGWLSRDSAVLVNNVFMSVALVTVFLGTTYPIIMAALDAASVSVGAPYYIAVFTPMLLPFAAAMGLSPMLAWRTTPHAALRRMVRLPVLMTIALLCVLLISPMPKNITVWVGMTAGIWVICATVADVLNKTDMLKRWRSITASQMAMTLAHIGFALMLIGATAATQWASQQTVWMKPGQRISFAGNRVLMVGLETGVGRNYNVDRAILTVQPANNPANMKFLMPEKRFYPVQETLTSESAISVMGFDIIHAVMADQDSKDNARWVVRLYYHPLVTWLFAGGALMAIGGAVSLLDRRRGKKQDGGAT